MARAFARARSAVTSVKEFKTGLCLAIRASAASVTASAEIFRPATACAMSEADKPSRVAVMARSRCKDTGRLGFVRQRELVHQPRQPQRYLEIGLDRRLPGILDRQRQSFGDGVDIIIKRISFLDRQRYLPISSSPAKAADPVNTGVSDCWMTRRSLSSGRPKAGPVGGA